MTDSKALTAFWTTFERHRDALSRLDSADDPVYDELLDRLQQISAGLYLEFSVQPGDCELIITAEGDRSLFACVDQIVAAAPRVRGWKIFALKPKLGFPETVSWDGVELAVADVVFEPLENAKGELGLRLHVPSLNKSDIDRAHNALLRAIDHGLGERVFAESVQFTKVVPLEGPADEHIPLMDLDTYVQWRKKRHERQ